MMGLLAPFLAHPSQRMCLPTEPQVLFSKATFCGSVFRNDPQKVSRGFYEGLTDAVCYTAKWLKSSLERLSEKSLGGIWSVGFGSPTLQEKSLYASFERFVRSSVRELESFHTVSEAAFSEVRLAVVPKVYSNALSVRGPGVASTVGRKDVGSDPQSAKSEKGVLASQLGIAERRTITRVMSSSCSQPSPTKE